MARHARKDEGGRPRFIGLLTTPWRVFLTSFVVSAVLLTAWSVSTPLFGPSDEETHIAHAVALVHGQLIGGTVKNDKDPYTKIQVPEVYAHIYAPCFAFNGASASCQSYSVSHPHRVVPTETYVGRYPPMYYAIVGLPSLIVTSTTGIYLMRTVSSLLGALFLALAIMSVFCWSSRRLLQIGVLLAATPTAAYYASAVNPNGLEIMAAICLWCSGIILVSERSDDPPRGLIAVVSISAGVLMLTRSLSPLWVAVILVLLVALGSPRSLFRLLLKRRDVQLWALLFVLCGVFAVVWVFAAHGFDLQPDATGAIPADRQLLHIYALTLGLSSLLLEESIAVVGWDRIIAPLLTYVLWGAVLGFVAIGALVSGKRRAIVVFATTILLVVIAPALLSASQIPPDGVDWAGRYTLPLAVGIPLLAVAMVDDGGLLEKLRPRVGTVICVAIAVGDALAFVEALRQNAVGIGGSLNYFNGSWSPPIGTIAATVWGIVAIALFALLCRALVGREVRSPRSDEHGDAASIVVGDVRYRVLPLAPV